LPLLFNSALEYDIRKVQAKQDVLKFMPMMKIYWEQSVHTLTL